MRNFVLVRYEDVSGISGTGTVVEGTLFSNGKIALTWLGSRPSVIVYDSIDDVLAIHGHNGATELVWQSTPEEATTVNEQPPQATAETWIEQYPELRPAQSEIERAQTERLTKEQIERHFGRSSELLALPLALEPQTDEQRGAVASLQDKLALAQTVLYLNAALEQIRDMESDSYGADDMREIARAAALPTSKEVSDD